MKGFTHLSIAPPLTHIDGSNHFTAPSKSELDARRMASLWIINKAGGLIYNVDYSKTPSGLSSNDYLILAGTLHGIHAITSRLSPTGAGNVGPRAETGVQQLQANGFDMNVMATATGEWSRLRSFRGEYDC